ncbi:hypothetical protein N0V95_004129 [Ascochyta clinopodiicola]|nr:hypothetical protein N0V95_004129 [Ascochyta clinopodiicola]
MPATRATALLSNPPHPTNPNTLMLDEQGFNWGPWTVSERSVIYEYVNNWISEHGLDAFASKTWTRDELEFVAGAINQVNATGGEGDAAPRSVTGVRRQIQHLHAGRLGPLAKLARRAEALKFRIEGEGGNGLGQVVLHEERFPDMAVPVPTLVDGKYEIRETSTVEESEEVASEMDASKTLAAQKENKEDVVKLSVNWARLHIRKNGKMMILEEGEVCDDPPTS